MHAAAFLVIAATQLVINWTVSHTLRVTFLWTTRALGRFDTHSIFKADMAIGQTAIILAVDFQYRIAALKSQSCHSLWGRLSRGLRQDVL
jgi:hypothetical protein